MGHRRLRVEPLEDRRLLAIVINEFHYDPDDVRQLEFIELHNTGPSAVSLANWRLGDAVDYTFSSVATISANQYLVIAQNAAHFQAEFGFAPFGEWELGDKLSNEGDSIELRDAGDELVDQVVYELGFPWPTSGEYGSSVELVNPTLDNSLAGNWRSSGYGSPMLGAPTPGQQNSVFSTNAAPYLRDLVQSVQQPAPGQSVVISMRVSDPQGIQSVTLKYQLVNPGDYIEQTDPRYQTSWTSLTMVDNGTNGDVAAGDGVYTATLNGSLQTHRRLVRYRVTASDALGATITAPFADDTQPNFAYFVYGETPTWNGAVQPGVTAPVAYDDGVLNSVASYHLITTRLDHVDAQHIPNSSQSGYIGSDYLWQGALVYDGVVYDHIHFRARGGVWRYAMGKNMWKFDFNRGHGFLARDNYGNQYEIPWDKLNLSALIQQRDFWHRGEQGLFESVGYKLFDLAGVPASNTNFVQFRIIERANENGTNQYTSDFQGLYLAVEQVDGNFLDEHDLPDGNLYKMEAGTGVGGIGGELNNQGDYPEVADSSDLIAFKNAYESATQTAAWWDQNLDLDQYYSYRSIVESIHHYDIGAGKNYFFFHNPETDKWETIPWDLDLTWANNMYGDGNEPFRNRVLAISQYMLEYRNRMREVRDLLFNTEQVGLMVDETAAFVYTPGQPVLVDADRAMWDYNPILASGYIDVNKAGQGQYYAGGPGVPAPGSFAGMMQLVKNYATTRGAWIDANVLTASEEAIIPTKPTLTYTGTANYPVDQLQFSTSAFSDPNGNAFGKMEWRVAEISNPNTPGFNSNAPWKYEVDAVWESGELTTYGSDIAVPGGAIEEGHTYRARVRMQDATGRWSHWSAPAEFVATAASAVPAIRIVEFHYHPAPNLNVVDEEDMEFIEIQNVGAQTVDMSGVQIADFATTPYVFASGTSLAPGERIVVARNPGVLEQVYGTGFNLVAAGYGTANLSNGGETIRLLTAGGVEIQRIPYTDDAPWPTSAVDGGGYSLVIVDPLGDGSAPANWQASGVLGGTPGMAEQSFLPGDFDQDGNVDGRDFLAWQRNPGVGVLSDWQGNYGNGQLAAISSWPEQAARSSGIDESLPELVKLVPAYAGDSANTDPGSAIPGLHGFQEERETAIETEAVVGESYVEQVDRALESFAPVQRFAGREFGEMVARRTLTRLAPPAEAGSPGAAS
jgi:hypothetical protein